MTVEKFGHPPRIDQDKIEALKSLFPDVFSEGKLNLERLRSELEATGMVGEVNEHYALSWVGKNDAKRLATMPPTGSLSQVVGRGFKENATRNLIIEGDNLEVLRLMRNGYQGRIKVIYIDPPYNTGHDFVYKDNFHEPVEDYLRRTGQKDDDGFTQSNLSSGGRFHSNWLTMMYPRLKLARDLLRDDGVIFISIDDNEQANLHNLMNEIFGVENYISTVCWKKKYSPANDTVDFSAMHEYIVCYAKQRKYTDSGRLEALLNKMDRTDEQNALYKNPDNDPNGAWMSGDYTCNKSAEQRPNLYYPILHPKTGKEVWPNPAAVWRYSKERHEQNVQEGRLWWGLHGENETPRYKRYLSEVGGVVANTWWDHGDVGHTDEAKKEFRALFPEAGDAFDTPKPTRLMKRILDLSTSNAEDMIVLDFFSGSGTMGQAVMEKNAEDGGSRQFILVQVPEPTGPGSEAQKAGLKTISDVTIERVKRAAKKLEGHPSKVDVGFKVYQLTRSTLNRFAPVKGKNLQQVQSLFESFSPLRQDAATQDILTEVMLTEGYPLDSKVEIAPEFDDNRVYLVTHPELSTRLLVCLDVDLLFDSTIEALGQYSKDRFVCLESALNDESKVRVADQVRKVKAI